MPCTSVKGTSPICEDPPGHQATRLAQRGGCHLAAIWLPWCPAQDSGPRSRHVPNLSSSRPHGDSVLDPVRFPLERKRAGSNPHPFCLFACCQFSFTLCCSRIISLCDAGQGYRGEIGQRDGFSAGDIKKLQSMYKCVGGKTMLQD